MMNTLSQEKGFSLIEVLVALAILMISIFAFTTLFTTSFQGIFRAGHKSEAMFEAQEKIDQAIAAGTNSGADNISIVFNDLTINLSGEEFEIDYPYDDYSGKLIYFLPK